MIACLTTYIAQLAINTNISLPELGITAKSTDGLRQLTDFVDDTNTGDSGDSDSDESTPSNQGDPL